MEGWFFVVISFVVVSFVGYGLRSGGKVFLIGKIEVWEEVVGV